MSDQSVRREKRNDQKLYYLVLEEANRQLSTPSFRIPLLGTNEKQVSYMSIK